MGNLPFQRHPSRVAAAAAAAAAQVTCVQIHEPCLVNSSSAAATGQASAPPGQFNQRAAFERSYARFAALGLPLKLHLVSFYDDLEEEVYQWAVQLPVAGLHLDFLGVGHQSCSRWIDVGDFSIAMISPRSSLVFLSPGGGFCLCQPQPGVGPETRLAPRHGPRRRGCRRALGGG